MQRPSRKISLNPKTLRRCSCIIVLSLLAGGAGAPILSQTGPKDPQPRTTSEWPTYGNDPGGMRFAALNGITPENVAKLKQEWRYNTGDRSDGKRKDSPSMSAFEATPILVGGRLVFCTPFNRVVALDPLTGKEIWKAPFDPKINLNVEYENQLTCRGVSAWTDQAPAQGQVCVTRIFTGTNDGRLIAINAVDGQPCQDFGQKGEIDLRREADIGPLRWPGEYQVTSPPAVFKNLVVVGSAIADNQRTDAPSGVVRAFDARTGQLRWAQDLVPADYTGPRSANGYALGSPNVWSIMSVDETLNMIYLPTGNPAPDFFGGETRPPDFYGSSVVALNGDTGKVVWNFQTVHHDLWDYDVPAQPALFTHYKDDGTPVPALAQATKTGHLFILDRQTGIPIEPIFGVTEIPVPQSPVMGEKLSPTQPFPNRPQSLGLQRLWPIDVEGKDCIKAMETVRSEGIFTPPSLSGTVFFPGSGGGLNWSGVAIDPGRRLLITNSTNVPWTVRLFPAADYDMEKEKNPKGEVRPQNGTPFGMIRSFFTQKLLFGFVEIPCNTAPWGRLNAVDLRTGQVKWQTDLGGYFGNDGLPSLGGAVLTSTGLAFIAGTLRDEYLRAFNVETKEMLWKHKLPAGGQATPMTYEVQDGDVKRQFVVIAAGGNGRAKGKLGDALVAFSLPKK